MEEGGVTWTQSGGLRHGGDAETLTFEKLLAVQAELLAQVGKISPPGPSVMAVWCVDRPALVEQLREMCSVGVRRDLPNGGILPFVGQFAGVPLNVVHTATLTVMERLRLPGCASVPGVWLMMSDGEVRLLEE